MTRKSNRRQWDDQDLHKLFAARLPAVPMPDGLVDRLTESVLQEVHRQVNETASHQYTNDMPGEVESSPTRCQIRKRRVPPTVW
jgi:hypothetical protein